MSDPETGAPSGAVPARDPSEGRARTSGRPSRHIPNMETIKPRPPVEIEVDAPGPVDVPYTTPEADTPEAPMTDNVADREYLAATLAHQFDLPLVPEAMEAGVIRQALRLLDVVHGDIVPFLTKAVRALRA